MASSPALLCCLLVGFLLPNGDAVAVMSVDFGSEWMKIAVVSPGVPMEIALNVESKRKTATAVAFRDGQRSFGEEALNVGIKYPEYCYKYFLDLLGKGLDHPLVARYRERFPHHSLEEDERGSVVFRHNETTTFSPEELVGMLLSHATSIAESFSGQKVKDAVVTVPPFFSQAERRAMVDAIRMADVNALQLINEHMAVALNYGMFRRKELNATAKNIMFFNMGASASWASIVSFQMVKTKERGFAETHPQAQVLGLGYDRTLGGMELQLSVRDMMLERFAKVRRSTTRDPRGVPRAMGKAFKEAGRVKLVLSANKDYTAQIENVLDDEDLRIPFNREEFETANVEAFARVSGPVDRALRAAGIELSEVDQVILFGGSTRVPKVQELLGRRLGGMELGKSLNTDEAAAMGAVYKAADLSSGFRVKKFITRDAVIFPIDVDFKREARTVRKTLFGLMNNYPQRKIMTFNKFTDDFGFDVNIGRLDHLEDGEASFLIGLNLSRTVVKGVAAAFEKNKADNTEPKGVKAHFDMDDSGILRLDTVEAVFEKNFTVEQQIEEEKEKTKEAEAEVKAEETEETWKKLGDKISSFFGGSGEGEEVKKEDEEDKKKDDKKNDGKKEKDKKEDDKKKDDKKKEDKKAKKEVPKKPIITAIKEPLLIETEILDRKVLNETVRAESHAKLRALAEHDMNVALRATAFNDLESFVIDIQAKLWEELYEKMTTEEEREKIRAKCSEISDWLYDEYTEEMPIETLKNKLKEVKDLTSGLTARVREHHDRPEAMEAVKKMLNTSTYFHAKAVNSTGIVDGFFTQEDLDSLGKLVNSTAEWLEKAEKTILEEPMHQMPTITASKVAEKGIKLDREVKYLANKATIAKRKSEEDAAKKMAEELAAKAAKEKKAKNKGNFTESLAEDPTTKSDEANQSDSSAKESPGPADEEGEIKGEQSGDVKPDDILEVVPEKPVEGDESGDKEEEEAQPEDDQSKKVEL